MVWLAKHYKAPSSAQAVSQDKEVREQTLIDPWPHLAFILRLSHSQAQAQQQQAQVGG